MSGDLARGKKEGCCAQATILVSHLHFPNVSSRSMREIMSVMIFCIAFKCRWLFSLFSNTKKHELSHVVMCFCSVYSSSSTHLSLCFPRLRVSDYALCSFGPVCLANLVSQCRQCHWRSNNIQYKSLIQGQNLSVWQWMKDETLLSQLAMQFITYDSVFLPLVVLYCTLLWQTCQHMMYNYTGVLLWAGESRNIWQQELDCV